MSLRLFFPVVSFVYGVGNWFTFLALMVYVQSEAGAFASAGVFLVQTVPALLVAGQIARAIPAARVRAAWVMCQLTLAAMTIPAAFLVEHIWTVYVYVAFSMIVRAVSNPLLMTLVTASTSALDRPAVLRSVSAISALTLAIAPAVGGSLLPVVGPSGLLLMNALFSLIVAAAVLLHPRLGANHLGQIDAPRRLQGRQSRRRWIRLPGFSALVRVEGTALRAWSNGYTRLWMLLLLAGAVLNIIETPLVFDVIQLDETQFGWMLAAYGAGGLVVLVSSFRGSHSNRARRRGSPRPAVLAGIGMAAAFLGLSMVTLASELPGRAIIAVSAFFLFGFGASWLSGTVRVWLDSTTRDRETSLAKSVWTWASQVTLAINLVVYLTFFLAYGAVPIGSWILIPGLVTYGVLLTALIRTPAPADAG